MDKKSQIARSLNSSRNKMTLSGHNSTAVIRSSLPKLNMPATTKSVSSGLDAKQRKGNLPLRTEPDQDAGSDELSTKEYKGLQPSRKHARVPLLSDPIKSPVDADEKYIDPSSIFNAKSKRNQRTKTNDGSVSMLESILPTHTDSIL